MYLVSLHRLLESVEGTETQAEKPEDNGGPLPPPPLLAWGDSSDTLMQDLELLSQQQQLRESGRGQPSPDRSPNRGPPFVQGTHALALNPGSLPPPSLSPLSLSLSLSLSFSNVGRQGCLIYQLFDPNDILVAIPYLKMALFVFTSSVSNLCLQYRAKTLFTMRIFRPNDVITCGVYSVPSVWVD